MCKIEVVSITISGSLDTSPKRKVPSPLLSSLSLSFSLSLWLKKLNISEPVNSGIMHQPIIVYDEFIFSIAVLDLFF